MGNDWVHTFTESGTFEVTQDGTLEILVVGGGASRYNPTSQQWSGGDGGNGGSGIVIIR